MSKTLSKVRGFCSRHARKLAVSGGLVASGVAVSGIAGATQPTVEETFTTTQTQVLQEFGYGAALLIAVMLFVIGITIVYKWSRKAAKQTA